MLRDGVRIRVASASQAEAVMRALQDGDPSIWVRTYGEFVNVSVAWLPDAHVSLVARRLKEALTPN